MTKWISIYNYLPHATAVKLDNVPALNRFDGYNVLYFDGKQWRKLNGKQHAINPLFVVVYWASSYGFEVVAHAQKVPELVRCRDCYAYRRDPELAKAADLDPSQYCALLRCEFGPDDFCSYGRRADCNND